MSVCLDVVSHPESARFVFVPLPAPAVARRLEEKMKVNPAASMTVADSRAASKVVLPTINSARLDGIQPSARSAWGSENDLEAQNQDRLDRPRRGRPPIVPGNPSNLSVVTGESLFAYALAGPLLVPGLMVGMAPWVCGFPYGPAATYVVCADCAAWLPAVLCSSYGGGSHFVFLLLHRQMGLAW